MYCPKCGHESNNTDKYCRSCGDALRSDLDPVPDANVAIAPAAETIEKNRPLLNFKELQSQSTLRLLLLSVITYYVYPAHYFNRLTKLTNSALSPENRISEAFTTANFIFAYLSVAMFFVYISVPEGDPLEALSGLANLVSGILLLIWAFKIRNRLNSLQVF